MKRQLILLSLGLLLGFSRLNASMEDPSPSMEDWSFLNYDKFMEEKFARPEISSEFVRQHAEVVSVRVSGDYQLETQVTLAADDRGEVSAWVVALTGADLRQQLSALKARMPYSSTEDVFSAVQLTRRVVSSKDLVSLQGKLAKFKSLKICALPGDRLTFPGALYKFWSRSSGGSYELSFSWLVPSASTTSYWGREACGQKLLAEWARDLFHALGVEPDTRIGAQKKNR